MHKRSLLLCLLVQAAVAQTTPRIDSLKRALVRLDAVPDGHSKDTLRYQTLRAIMRSYGDQNLDSAFHYNTLLLELCRSKKLHTQLVFAAYYTGILCQLKGEHFEAINHHYKALEMAEKLKLYPQMAASYGQLAHAYSSLDNHNKALALCKQGLAVLRNSTLTESYQERLLLLNALGVVHRARGDLANALRVNQEMYELGRTPPYEPWYESHGLHAMGLVYKEQGDLQKAVVFHKKALAIAQQNGRVELTVNILVNIADIYIRQKNWRQAVAFCQQAKRLAMQAKNSRIIAEADKKLYTVYRQTGQLANALQAYESFVSLRDSLSQETSQQRIELLQAQYTTTNALQQERVRVLEEQNRNGQLAQTRNGLFGGIAAVLLMAGLLLLNNRQLQAKNQEINRQRGQLETARKQLAEINKTLESRVDERTAELLVANRELIQKNEEIKQALFKGQTIERKRVALELHDNLSSLLSAINMSMQTINSNKLSEPEQVVYQNVRQLIQNAYVEVRNISHNILPANLEREGLANALTTLINQFNQNATIRFILTLSGLQERLPVEIELNLYSVVLELINNTIRHANATQVAIQLSRTEDGINLSVTDDGVGFGTVIGKRGVGLQNIQMRLDSLGGTFEIRLPHEPGTRIDIKIPIETERVDGNVSVGLGR